MKKLPYKPQVYLVVAALVALLALSSFTSGSAHAATHSNGAITPACATSFTAALNLPQIAVNTMVRLVIGVHCPTAQFIDVGIDWRDGTASDVHCGEPLFGGCSGNVTLETGHTFRVRGTFLIKVFTTTVSATPAFVSIKVI